MQMGWDRRDRTSRKDVHPRDIRTGKKARQDVGAHESGGTGQKDPGHGRIALRVMGKVPCGSRGFSRDGGGGSGSALPGTPEIIDEVQDGEPIEARLGNGGNSEIHGKALSKQPNPP